MTEPTAEQIAKLPKWAQEYIHALRRANMEAARYARASEDRDTPSPVSYTDLICDNPTGCPSWRKKYVQTHGVTVEHGGVAVTVRCDSYAGFDGVTIASVDVDRLCDNGVAYVPTGHGQMIVQAIPRAKGGAS